MEDIEEMSSAHESELATLRAKLDRRGPAPPSTEAEFVQLRSQITGLEDELANLTQRFNALDHTWVGERAALEGDEPSEPQLAFCRLQIELVEREEASFPFPLRYISH